MCVGALNPGWVGSGVRGVGTQTPTTPVVAFPSHVTQAKCKVFFFFFGLILLLF